MLKIALQLYSIRDLLPGNFADLMQKLSQMGYDGVEIAGTYGLEAQAMKQECDAAGLSVVSAHIPFADMVADPAYYAAYFETIGCKQAVIP